MMSEAVFVRPKLRWGDTVAFCVEWRHTDKANGKEQRLKGHVFSETLKPLQSGILDPPLKTECVVCVWPEGKGHGVPNVQFVAFEVLPPKEKLTAEEKKCEQENYEKKLKKLTAEEKKKLPPPSETTLHEQIRKCEEEKYEKKFKKLKGIPIYYDECVQFRHEPTRCFLAVDRTCLSYSNDKYLKVHLTLDVYDEGSLFKFQPHKGFKCLGEEVHCYDEVNIKNTKTDLFLCRSTEELGHDAVHEKCFEVCAAGFASPMKILPHFRPPDDGTGVNWTAAAAAACGVPRDAGTACKPGGKSNNEQKKKEKKRRKKEKEKKKKKEEKERGGSGAMEAGGGDEDDVDPVKKGAVVTISHWTLPYYLTAEGSFADATGEPAKDVHWRRARFSSSVVLKSFPSSANTYWQFESVEEPLSGELLSVGEEVFMKHMTTRLYLAVEEQSGKYKVSLKQRGDDSRDDSMFVFQLRCELSQKDIILDGCSCVHLYHPKTETWLKMSLEDGLRCKYERGKSDCRIPVERLQWDDRELAVLKACQDFEWDDAVTIWKVISSTNLEALNFVAGFARYMQHAEECIQDAQKRKRIVEVVKYMKRRLEDSATGVGMKKRWQKLLRNFRLVDLLVRILEKAEGDEELCRACFDLLTEYIEVGKLITDISSKSKIYMAKHLTCFKEYFERNVHAEELVSVMICNNLPVVLLLEFKEKTFIDDIVNLFLKTKSKKLLKIFENLCVCCDRVMPGIQKHLMEYLLQRGQDVFHQLTSESMQSESDEMLQFLTKFCSAGNSATVDYLEARGLVDCETLLNFLQNDTAPFQFKAHCLGLLSAMLVETEECDVLEEPPNVFLISEGTGRVQSVLSLVRCSSRRQDNCLFRLMDWVKEYLREVHMQVRDARENSCRFSGTYLLDRALQLVGLLLKKGLCPTTEYRNAILSSVASLIHVFAEKNEAVQVLEVVLEFEVIDTIKELIERIPSLVEGKEVEGKSDVTEIRIDDKIRKLNETLDCGESQKMTNSLCCLMNYRSVRLKQGSPHLLFSLHGMKETVYSRCQKAIILRSKESGETFCDLIKLMSSLRLHLRQSNTRDATEDLKRILSICTESDLNRLLVASFGIEKDILDFILAEVTTEVRHCYENEEVYAEFFKLLRALAVNNYSLKERLFESMSDFLDIGFALPYMAQMLTEVFCDRLNVRESNVNELHFKVLHVEESHVQRIFDLMETREEAQNSLLLLLYNMAMVEELNLPIKKNMLYIMKYFTKSLDELLKDFGTSAEKKENRGKLLIEAQHDDRHLNVLLNVTNLTAMCCDGGTVYFECICQNFMTTDEVLDILGDPRIPCVRKPPFVRFLLGVYNSDPLYDKENQEWVKNYLSQVAEALEVTKDYLGSKNDEDFPAIQAALREYRRERVATDSSTMGNLPYIIWGVIPLLRRYYDHDFKEKESYVDEAVGKRICKLLMEIAGKLSKCFIFNSQARVFQVAVMSILCKTGDETIAKEVKDKLKELKVPSPEESTEVERSMKFSRTMRKYQPTGIHYTHLKSEIFEKFKCDKTSSNFVQFLSGLLEMSFKRYFARCHNSYFQDAKGRLKERAYEKQSQLDTNCILVIREFLERTKSPSSSFDKTSFDTLLLFVNHPNKKISEEAVMCCTKVVDIQRRILKSGLLQSNESVQIFLTSLRNHLDESNRISSARISLFEIFCSRCEKELEQEEQFVKKFFESSLTVNTPQVTSNNDKTAIELSDVGRSRSSILKRSRSSILIFLESSYWESVKELVKVFDSDFITNSLKLLQSICVRKNEKQCRKMQDYLRRQNNYFMPIRVVDSVAAFAEIPCEVLMSQLMFHEKLKEKNITECSNDYGKENINMICAVLNTLAKLCDGNIPNQFVVHQHQIANILCRVLSREHEQGYHWGASLRELVRRLLRGNDQLNSCEKLEEDFIRMRGSALKLLAVMVERTDEKSDVLGYRLYREVGEALQKCLRDDDFKQKEVKNSHKAYCILLHLKDYLRLHNRGITEKEDSEPAVKFKENVKTIEVSYSKTVGGEKTTILTPVHFYSECEIREPVKETLKWNINRDSTKDKHIDLLEWIEPIKKDIHYQRELQNSRWKYSVIHNKIFKKKIRWSLLLFLTIVLNIFVSFGLVADRAIDYSTYNVTSASRNAQYPMSPLRLTIGVLLPWYVTAFWVFGVLHLFLATWLFLENFLVNKPHFIYPVLIRKLRSSKHVEKAVCELFYFKRTPYEEQEMLELNFMGFQNIYIWVFWLCSFLSLVFYGYFYCFCLLYIVIENDTLRRVLRSVTEHGKQLLWVAGLGVAVLFIYGVIAFASLNRSFTQEDDLFCDNVFECFVSVIRTGLIDNVFNIPVKDEEFWLVFARLIYDLSFFIIVITIGLNLVFGIILDTFGELRSKKWEAEKDMKEMCFICGVQSSKFKFSNPMGFYNHTHNSEEEKERKRKRCFKKIKKTEEGQEEEEQKTEEGQEEEEQKSGKREVEAEEGMKTDYLMGSHCLWNYVHYSLYLDGIAQRSQENPTAVETDLTAVEKYVYDKMKKKESDFFPEEASFELLLQTNTEKGTKFTTLS